MSEVLNKVIESSTFYNSNMLQIDYKQVEFCYRSLKPYFKGNIGCELGPSTGYMTKYLLNDFEQLDVIEGALELLQQIPDNKKLTKYHSLFEDFTPARKYDTIIMNHVLEHIEKPVELLANISTWLNDDGVFLIGVPNAKSFHRLAAVKMGLLSSEFELNDRDKALGHYRVYDFKTLVEHAQQAGLKLLNKGGVFLKFMSNAQIEATCNESMLEAYYALSSDFAENCAEIFVVCKK
jgi:2-polyprenyl-3-methyl-5-hydroxy-6-metoxy-1,4-benzoquinol methylase